LRPPQLGALYEALGHWQVTHDPATVVLPTGTGKTETMLALLTCKRLERLLVVVPWSALREQITAKFVTLGLLKKFGVVGGKALYPVVGALNHHLYTPEQVEVYFRHCNVIVTTMSVVSGCSEEVQRKMSEMCSHLFIDEAHHISAPTWDKFRRRFLEKPILQFTATPYRTDGKHVDGKIICNYPLRKAQEEGYFKPVNFVPVRAYYTQTADREIAQAAVRQLELDLSHNLNHILMARARTIARAEEVYQVYQRQAAAHNPLLIHSGHGDAQKREAIRLLREGKSRVIVCVNMLGEGFDLPELKIAALHDRHKSLAVTLQFMGRFTRTRSDIGDATVVANIGLCDVDETLQELYAEDADWNFLLRRLSEGATGRQLRRSEFIEGFSDAPAEIPLQNIFPKMSAVVYRTRCRNWRPKGVLEAVKDSHLHTRPAINHKHKVLLFVTCERTPIAWGSVKELYDTTWNLHLMHWDAGRGLLFINSSSNDGAHEELAKAVAGDDVEMIRGEQVFRSLHGVKRPILMNLGLKNSLSRAVRFTMYVGSDIHEGLTDAQRQNKIKSNTFARGYEGGEKATVGCSVKGRVWSYLIAYDLSEWVEWCRKTGAKLLDDSISVEEIFKNILVPKQVQARPALVPLAIEWSEDFLLRSEDAVRLDVAGEVVSFFDAGMELVEHKSSGPLRFRIFTESKSVEYEVQFRGTTVELRWSRETGQNPLAGVSFLMKMPSALELSRAAVAEG
jgi:superfamily II DNA or RNA helicase